MASHSMTVCKNVAGAAPRRPLRIPSAAVRCPGPRVIWRSAAAVGLALALGVGTLAGQPPSPRLAIGRVPGIGDSTELAGFVDGIITTLLRERKIAGAVVAIVKDGRLVLSTGYGLADVARRIPVDPATTLFRAGSVSKLFTWTAVMQQVEAGRIDLDRDVNDYLDEKIPATFAEPITMRHLMTHTAGFEDDARGLISTDSTSIVPMGPWLAAHRPARVRPPGTFSAYSNYSTALAGSIVERVSGIPYPRYIEERIFAPLGMRQATFVQPVPSPLAADQSLGYRWSDGRFEPMPFEYTPAQAPVGSLTISGEAMSRFMLAHLGAGALGGARILTEASARAMQERGFAHHPALSGWGLGFYEMLSHGARIIGHGGDTQWFHSLLWLFPEDQLGVFVSYNTDTGGAVTDQFREIFLDHYYPPSPVPAAVGDFATTGTRFEGTYLGNRRGYTTFLTAFGLGGALVVRKDSDSTLAVTTGGSTRVFVPAGPLLFVDRVTGETLGFREEDGRIGHAFFGELPMMAFERVGAGQDPGLHLKLLGLGIVVSLGVVVAAVVRLFRRRAPKLGAGPGRQASRLLALAAGAVLAFAIGGAVLLGDPSAIIFGTDRTRIGVVLAFPVIAAIATAGALIAVVLQWARGSAPARISNTLVALVLTVFLWSLSRWNLLGWHW